jgi:hypothetical protein
MSVHDLRRAIEPLKARAHDRELARRRGQVEPNPELLARLESAVSAAQSIENTLAELAAELSGLLPFRRLGYGGWMVGVSGSTFVVRPGRRPRLSFTHFEVLVTVREDGQGLDFACHRCVLDHDLDVLRFTQPLAAGESALSEWLEAACLEFAEAVLSARADQSWRPHRATRTP